MTQAKLGLGATISVGGNILGAHNLNFTYPSKERLDVTAFDSASREYIAGLGGEGQLTFSVWWNDTQHSNLITLMEAGDAIACSVTLPDTSSWSFDGLLTNISVVAEPAGAMRGDITVTITGAVT